MRRRAAFANLFVDAIGGVDFHGASDEHGWLAHLIALGMSLAYGATIFIAEKRADVRCAASSSSSSVTRQPFGFCSAMIRSSYRLMFVLRMTRSTSSASKFLGTPVPYHGQPLPSATLANVLKCFHERRWQEMLDGLESLKAVAEDFRDW